MRVVRGTQGERGQRDAEALSFPSVNEDVPTETAPTVDIHAADVRSAHIHAARVHTAHLHTVRTPENVTFEYELAGIPSRALAWGIDVLVMLALLLGTQQIASALGVLGGFAVVFALVGAFLVQWWYSALCEWKLGGQTVGKKVVGLRTLQLDGLRITFLQATIRNLCRIVDLLPAVYLVGGLAALLDGHGRRLGDLAAGTVVVRERRAPRPAAVVDAAERQDGFLRDPAVRLAARRITPPERDAMVALGLRREELPLSVRHSLFERLSGHLEARLGIPRPAYFSAEKFVLHLTAVVLGEKH